MSSVSDNKVVDLSSMLSGFGEEIDLLKKPLEVLASILFQDDVDAFVASAYSPAVQELLPTAEERSQFTTEFSQYGRKKKADLRVAVAAKDFRNYPTYSLQEEDDFL